MIIDYCTPQITDQLHGAGTFREWCVLSSSRSAPRVLWVLKLRYFARRGQRLDHILSHFSLTLPRKTQSLISILILYFDPSLYLSVYLFGFSNLSRTRVHFSSSGCATSPSQLFILPWSPLTIKIKQIFHLLTTRSFCHPLLYSRLLHSNILLRILFVHPNVTSSVWMT